MGNYASCALSAAAGSHSSKCAKVILPGGEFLWIDGPANAAELMLDVPGHFLVDSRSMHVGRRLAPLAADEDLEMGVAYVMFPMKRASSAVTAADMAALLVAVNKVVRRASPAGSARVLPEAAAPRAEPEAAEDARQRFKLEELLQQEKMDEVADQMAEVKYRVSVCRSRRPTLETIPEEGICSR